MAERKVRCEESFFKVVVYIAMSEKQAAEQNTCVCLEPALPSSESVYFKLKDIPDDLCVSKKIGWETTICAQKKNSDAILNFLYPEKTSFDFKALLDQVNGELFWLTGFSD